MTADPTLYLFDGYNLLHAGWFRDVAALRDVLAGFVAVRGARGVLVLDGAGTDARYGALEVRYAPDADALLERLAAERRDHERVCLVSSDFAVRGTSGQQVTTMSSRLFVSELELPARGEDAQSRLGEALDAETRAPRAPAPRTISAGAGVRRIVRAYTNACSSSSRVLCKSLVSTLTSC